MALKIDDLVDKSVAIKGILGVLTDQEAAEIYDDMFLRCWICDSSLELIYKTVDISRKGPTISGFTKKAEPFIFPHTGVSGYLCHACLNKRPDYAKNYDDTGEHVMFRKYDFDYIVKVLNLIWVFFEDLNYDEQIVAKLNQKLMDAKMTVESRNNSVWSVFISHTYPKFMGEFRRVIESLTDLAIQSEQAVNHTCLPPKGDKCQQ
jgi:hypothetical protein